MNEIDYSAEVWRDVVGYEGVYAVSDKGRVMRTGAGKAARVGRILTPARDGGEYLYVRLSKNNIQKNGHIHVMVADAFIPLDPERPQVNHKNGIKSECYLSNLERATPRENVRHSIQIGLNKYIGAKAEERKVSRLSQDEISLIARLISEGLSAVTIARRVNRSHRTICNIGKKLHSSAPVPVELPNG